MVDREKREVVRVVLHKWMSREESVIVFGLSKASTFLEIEGMVRAVCGKGPSADSIRLAHKPHIIEYLKAYVWRESINNEELDVLLRGCLTPKRRMILPAIEMRLTLATIADTLGVNYESIRVRLIEALRVLDNSDNVLLKRYADFIRTVSRIVPFP